MTDTTTRAVTVSDAADRRWVNLPDGRTGRLCFVPTPGAGRGRKARVQLPSGEYVNAEPHEITLMKRRARRRDGNGAAQLDGRYWLTAAVAPRLADGTVDIRAWCRQLDAAYNESLE